VKKRFPGFDELIRFGPSLYLIHEIMDNQETAMFRIRQQYELIVDWFRLNGGKDKNGAPKHPEVPAGLPLPETATIAQIQLIAELLQNGVLEKYKTALASNGVTLGMIADEIRSMLAAMNGKA
jgi:hypothetical protein